MRHYFEMTCLSGPALAADAPPSRYSSGYIAKTELNRIYLQTFPQFTVPVFPSVAPRTTACESVAGSTGTVSVCAI